MKVFGRLAVSIASNVIDDTMRVILHESDYPLIEGVVSGDVANNTRSIAFLTPDGDRVYPFDDVRDALAAFVEEMALTRNFSRNDLARELDGER